MNTIEYADTGVQVSELCLGTMMFGDRCDKVESDRILSSAIDNGVTFIDTAAAYCKGLTEEILGEIMKGKRDGLFLGTKVTKSTDAAWVRQSLDESLSRLQTDYVDLYMIHWPRATHGNRPHDGGAERRRAAGQGALRGMLQLSGLVAGPLQRGCAGQRLGAAHLQSDSLQPCRARRGGGSAAPGHHREDRYHRLSSAVDGLPGGQIPPGCPTARRFRGYTDKRVSDWMERFGDSLAGFLRFAEERNLHPAQLSVAWVRKSAGVSCPISGVSSLGQLQASIDAMSVDLSDEEYAELTGLFDTAVKEESGGNFAGLRRATDLVVG